MIWGSYRLKAVIFITIATSMIYVFGDEFPTLDIKKNHLSVEDIGLYTPPLSLLAEALSTGLRENYAEVSVQEVDCPDLTAPPFHLASKGLSGSTTLVRVGGITYVMPRRKNEKVYDLVDIGRNAVPNVTSFAINGAAGGPFMMTSEYCEEVLNLKVNENKSVVNECRLFYTKSSNTFNMVKVPPSELRIAYFGNMFVSEGKTGKVVRIKVKKRIGNEANFIAACRRACYDAFGWKVVGIGGVFIVKHGLTTHSIANDWTRFFNITAPLTSVGTFLTDDIDLNVRLEHFHSFSKDKRGGYYLNDVDADNIEYEAYFNVVERAVFIDRPNI